LWRKDGGDADRRDSSRAPVRGRVRAQCSRGDGRFMGRYAGLIAGRVAGGAAAAAAAVTVLLAGCTASRPAPDIKADDVAVKIAGIRQAQARQDRASLPALVEQLDSDDPAVRMFALGALEKFSGGERFGYEYYLDEEQRKPSLAKWRQWLEGQATK